MMHNKYTNITLIYTGLMHKIAEAMLSESVNVLKDASIAKNIIKKHFGLNSSLHLYLEIANAILKSNMINEKKEIAVLFLKEIEEYIKEKTWKNYEKQKIAFLKEVKKYFRLENLVYSGFPNYKTLASTHLFIESCMGIKNISKISDKVKICSNLVERLIVKNFPQNTTDIQNFIKENNISKSTVLIAVNQLKNKVSTLKESHKQIVSLFLVENDLLEISRQLKLKVKLYLSELKELQKYSNDDKVKTQLLEIISNLKRVEISSDKNQLEELAEKLIDIDDLIEIFKKGK